MPSKSISIKFPFSDSPDGFFLATNKTTQDAIRSDLVHLLLTKKGDRYYLPEFGTDLYKFLFEPSDSLTFSDIRRDIEEAISKFIPNLTLNDIQVTYDDDKTITVTVDYSVTEGALATVDRIVITF